jgi:ubiquinone/menaquinone biosynthesis C-methylase UbiE
MAYLMENSEEDQRLDLKTGLEAVQRQAGWAGIGPGMKILDVGCGIGKTTRALADLVGPTGSVVGIDSSDERLEIARARYGSDRIRFEKHDITKPFLWHEEFDGMWLRFILEYFKEGALDLLNNVTQSLKPGGILCLADSDCNSLLHYGHSQRLQNTLQDIMNRLEQNFNFDPYAGRKLYDYLYQLEYNDIEVMMEPHHLIYGALRESDAYNWKRKLELTAEQSGCELEEYAGTAGDDFQSRHAAFKQEFEQFFSSPRRFTYTPIIIARGHKP